MFNKLHISNQSNCASVKSIFTHGGGSTATENKFAVTLHYVDGYPRKITVTINFTTHNKIVAFSKTFKDFTDSMTFPGFHDTGNAV